MNIDSIIEILCDSYPREKDRVTLIKLMEPAREKLRGIQSIEKGTGLVVVAEDHNKNGNPGTYVATGDATGLRDAQRIDFSEYIRPEDYARSFFTHHVTSNPESIEFWENMLELDMTPCLAVSSINGIVKAVFGQVEREDRPTADVIIHGMKS